MIPDTATRVQQHTAPQLNEKIHQELQERVARFKSDDRSALITQRLDELDREWDVERVLQTNFATISLVALTLATQVDKRWYALALAVPAFMVQHALQGWCPPLAVLRRLGFRTSKEINEERFALKALRGDFNEAGGSSSAESVLRAVKT
jgi:hypothetical protein